MSETTTNCDNKKTYQNIHDYQHFVILLKFKMKQFKFSDLRDNLKSRFTWSPRLEFPDWRWAKNFDWISQTHYEVSSVSQLQVYRIFRYIYNLTFMVFCRNEQFFCGTRTRRSCCPSWRLIQRETR